MTNCVRRRRTHTNRVVFTGITFACFDRDAMRFQRLGAILDYVAHEASISCVIVFLAAVSWNLLPLEVERLQPFSLFAVFHKVSEVLLIYSNFH